MNDSLKRNQVASATKTAVKICENTTVLIVESDHTIDDDTNEDCQILLGVHISDSDEVNADYISMLAKYNPVIGTDNDEVDESYGSFFTTYDPVKEIYTVSSHSGGSNIDSASSGATAILETLGFYSLVCLCFALVICHFCGFVPYIFLLEQYFMFLNGAVLFTAKVFNANASRNHCSPIQCSHGRKTWAVVGNSFGQSSKGGAISPEKFPQEFIPMAYFSCNKNKKSYHVP